MNTILEKRHSKQLEFLDGLRGLAALYVVIGHARWLLWEGFSTGYTQHPDQYSLPSKILMYFFSLFKYGHEAVMLFFILSGFVIHLKNSKYSNDNSQYNLPYWEYFFKRLNRIYPPLVLAIIITLIFDLIGSSLHLPIYFPDGKYPHIYDNITTDHSLKTLVGNLAFLMKGYVNVWGTNGPLWSLFYEWWFYMLYPVIFFVYRKSMIVSSLFVISLFIISTFIPGFDAGFLTTIFSYLIIWWLGALMADIYNERKNSYAIFIGTLAIVIPLMFIMKTAGPVIADLFVSIMIIPFFFLLIYISKKGLTITLIQVFKPIGDFSYSLYVCHLPILVFFCGFVLQKNNHTLPQHFGYVITGIFVCLILCYLFYLLVEKPFTKHQYLLKARGRIMAGYKFIRSLSSSNK